MANPNEAKVESALQALTHAKKAKAEFNRYEPVDAFCLHNIYVRSGDPEHAAIRAMVLAKLDRDIAKAEMAFAAACAEYANPTPTSQP